MTTPTPAPTRDQSVYLPGGQDLLGPLLQQMATLAAAKLSPAPGRVFVSPAFEVAWDDCCAGQVWTRLTTLEPLNQRGLGGGKLGGAPCEQAWLATVGVGVLRCAASLNDQGMAPSPATLTADATQVTADAAMLCAVIQCDFQPLGLTRIQRWDALGPDGGCAGGEWTIQMKVRTFGCPDDDEPVP